MITCPHCNSTLNLEQLTEDAQARRLFSLLRTSGCAAAIVAYLGLFKPAKQALRWSRASALAEELLQRWGTDPRLGTALTLTVEALREKRQSDGWRPLSNHNYLASVLQGLPPAAATLPAPERGKTRDRSLADDLHDTSWAK